ncbi:Transcription accessory protein (S1 RNA-binding domain) [Olavius sp. associated proteobacterium Delta 1]|nr:Transcription accessory protein (S1 RNA-binding domain) [Olavius sp. associated proteobacterium Delta 1]
MTESFSDVKLISSELNLKDSQVKAVQDLLAEGSTVPFIARYRKEATGSLDEVIITSIRDRLQQLAELGLRKESILKSLEDHGHLTEALKEDVLAAQTLALLEDLYLPYRPKRRTRAMIAREKGLEPLALILIEQNGTNPQAAAAEFVDPEKAVDHIDAALAGARDIIAEIINEDQRARTELRELYFSRAVIKSQVASGKEAEGAKFRDYFDWQEAAATAPSHRILAMRRGEKEDFLNISIAPPADKALKILEDIFVTGDQEDAAEVKLALQDSYKRLLSRSMETEIRLATKNQADTEAIKVFSGNLRELLLSPPLGARRVMGIDPGYRTGCKLVCLDPQGKLEHHDTIYPHTSKKQLAAAARLVRSLVDRYKIEAIAVGNGTAGRETVAFVNNLGLGNRVQIVMVNESGASIYSASAAARQEFPDLDLTVRGSISIARRLMDPLSELVKIDPKSIGVGQYQHDVDQAALKQSLDDIVISCVNSVGVEVNQASVQLLTYVSGLGPRLARNIVAYREQNGPFASRAQLSKVPRLGPKAFEQSAGFLRIRDGKNPLDGSAVHPESYHVVMAMAKDLDCTVANLMQNMELRQKIDINQYISVQIGAPTLNDILSELSKPGRDPRQDFEKFEFASDVGRISDLNPGMKIPGIVTNVTAFGAFVDIGVHQDGLVHISELADRFVKNPADVVRVQQKVAVTVLDVDMERNRISLSMKTVPVRQPNKAKPSVIAKKSKAPSKNSKSKNTPFNNPFADLQRFGH